MATFAKSTCFFYTGADDFPGFQEFHAHFVYMAAPELSGRAVGRANLFQVHSVYAGFNTSTSSYAAFSVVLQIATVRPCFSGPMHRLLADISKQLKTIDTTQVLSL